ncbi:MAG: carboxypeptidase regulatory-like domain-containing protein [Deltaproteobacteria bacterium]|nr:carboxypeptidase regulatory-like domain-containing protein [Deltaproteobacteria bacterium]
MAHRFVVPALARKLIGLLPVLSLALLAGCQGGSAGQLLEDAVRPDEEGLTLLLAQDDLLHRQFSGAAEGGFTTEILGTGERSFNRVGLRIDAHRTPVIEASGSPDGVAFGPWHHGTITYQDGFAYNAHVDLEHGSRFLRLRLSGIAEEDLSFLSLEVFTFEPLAGLDPGFEPELQDAPEGLGQLRSNLAADGVAVMRSQWGARATQCTSRHTPVRMAIHHTVTPNNDTYDMPRRVRQIQAYHMDSRGWCDVGYHFLIGQDGEVYQAREETYIGAHVANHNTQTAGISFIGDFTSIVPSQAMLDAGARIVRSLSSTYGISIDRTAIKGHREFSGASTACPGNAFYPTLDAFVALAASGGGGGGGGGGATNGTLRGAVFWGTDFAADINDTAKRISGATVTLSNGDVDTTDADGWYQFDVPAGSYTATITAAGYQSGTLARDVSAGTTAWGSVMLTPAATSTGTVKGVVFWGATLDDYAVNVGDASKRIAGATVTFSPGGRSASTDSSGWYEIDLPVGTYTLTASAAGYQDATRPDPVTVTESAVSWGSTMVLGGPTVGVDDRAAPIVTISSPSDGAVVDIPELIVVGTIVDDSPIAYLRANGSDVTVTNGTFRHATFLTPGENQIVFEAADDLNNVGTQTLTVTYVGEEASGVRGFVYDAARGPEVRIADATIQLTGPEDRQLKSDAAGAFDLDLPVGNYLLSIRAPGFDPYQNAVVVTAGSRTRVEAGLALEGSSAGNGVVEITFPAAGELIEAKRVLVTGKVDPEVVVRVVVSGQDATLVGEDFSSEVTLAKGANHLVAVAFDASGAELARATVDVTRKAGALGCQSAGGGAPGLAFTFLGLLGLLGVSAKRRRR